MAFLGLVAIFVVLLVILMLGLAMRDSYDGFSFTLLGLLGGLTIAFIAMGTALIIL